MNHEHTISSLQSEAILIQTTSNSSAHDLSIDSGLFLDNNDNNEVLSGENQDESFMSISSILNHNRTLSKRKKKVSAVHDYIIEQSDGLTLCKICHVHFGKKTATSTITWHFNTIYHSTYLTMNQCILNVQHFHPYGHRDQAKVDDINKKLMHWFVADQMPFMLIDSKWFRTFANALNERYTPSCRQTMTK